MRVDNPCAGSRAVHRYGDLIAVEVRCSWPEPATEAEMMAALAEAFTKATDAYTNERGWGLDV